MGQPREFEKLFRASPACLAGPIALPFPEQGLRPPSGVPVYLHTGTEYEGIESYSCFECAGTEADRGLIHPCPELPNPLGGSLVGDAVLRKAVPKAFPNQWPVGRYTSTLSSSVEV